MPMEPRMRKHSYYSTLALERKYFQVEGKEGRIGLYAAMRVDYRCKEFCCEQ